MIGIYGVNTKPAQFNEISADTISEIKEMTETGLLSVRFNKYIAIKLTAVICDAPARSDVRYTVNHNGKAGCDRCVVDDRRLDGKMTFPNGEYTLRTDDSFRSQTQSIHHQGHSLFESLPIDMTSTFPLDPMHMVYLGVTKKLVTFWIELGHKRLKNVNSCVIRSINKLISRCVESTPSDFQRKCRTLDYVSVWKASECRLFLLYSGPVILRNILPEPLYLNFKRLALSMYLLAHPQFYNRVIESVRMDLRNFLRKYECCYGCENLVYDVHSPQHLPDDVRAHGPLDSYSEFPFESYMRQIKKSVHGGYSVAKQAAQRYAEQMSFCDRLQVDISTNDNPVIGKADSRKQVIMFRNSQINSFKPDNVVVVNRKPGLITDIQDSGLLKFRPFTDPQNYFEDPLPSTNKGIFKCSVVSSECSWVSNNDVDCKCMSINCVNHLVIVPLLHTVM
uniref:DNA-directed RNA polymerase n=1 Tax=Schistosoma mansoni TaxID=6183 RepID=A0A3Q0KTE6_SCHMA